MQRYRDLRRIGCWLLDKVLGIPTYSGSKDSLTISPDIGRNMTNKILRFQILGLIVFQSGCALEKYHQGSEDYSMLRYSQDEVRSGTQSGPSPG
jgi:hypothetical protein